MLGSYRGRLDIIVDILGVAGQNAKKTQIMYKANLSYKVLQRYLAEVTEAALIRFESKTRCYVLTEKGKRFLEEYRKYHRSHKRIEKQLNEMQNQRQILEELCSNS
jgi:predicted transcriptional regulator